MKICTKYVMPDTRPRRLLTKMEFVLLANGVKRKKLKLIGKNEN